MIQTTSLIYQIGIDRAGKIIPPQKQTLVKLKGKTIKYQIEHPSYYTTPKSRNF